jgi:hypothetical protein
MLIKIALAWAWLFWGLLAAALSPFFYARDAHWLHQISYMLIGFAVFIVLSVILRYAMGYHKMRVIEDDWD